MNLKEDWTHAHTRTVIAAVFVLGLLVWLYVHESKNKGQELAELKTFIAQKEADRNKQDADAKAALAAAQARIEELEKQKQQVITQPALAPQIIREYIPTSTPIQQTAPITKDTLPDAPIAQLTLKNEQDLAAFALTCKQCDTERDALKKTIATKENDIQTLTEERDKAVQTSQGGSVWHRVTKIMKVSACAGLGAGAGATVRKPGSAAIGAAAGAVICSVVGK
jgi:hypothetical protein